MPKEVKIGAVVIAIIALTVWGYLFLKGKDIFNKTISIVSYYNYVDQLSVSAPILINGVKVGNVTDVKLNPKNIEEVQVKFTIEGVSHVPKTAIAELKSTGIMGGKAIEILFDRPCTENCIEDGDVLKSKHSNLISSMIGSDMNGYVKDIQTKFEDVFNNDMPDSLDFKKVLHDLQNTINNLNTISSKTAGIISSSTYDIKNISSSMKDFSSNLNQQNAKINQVIANLADFSERLKSVELDQTISKANKTLDVATNAVSSLKSTIANATNTIGDLNKVIKKVEHGDGSLSLLLNNRKLYDDLQESSRQLNLLLQDIRLNPKRYVNVSVFGKKQKTYTLPAEDPALEEKN